MFAQRRWQRSLAADAGVDVLENGAAVLEVEVLVEIARRFLARGPVESHVQRDQTGALGVVAARPGLTGVAGAVTLGVLVLLARAANAAR